MVIAGIPREEIRHSRAVQDWLAEGRREGLQAGREEGLQGACKRVKPTHPATAQPPLRPPE